MTDYESINFEIEGPIATITLNRPKAANGLNAKMASELAEIAQSCKDNAKLRAVILTAGGRFFCAGGDVKEMHSHGDNIGPEIASLADDLHKAISIFSRMDAPLIMAVNGMAAGAGFSLAVSGDLVIASREASFMMAYTKAGLSPDGSSSYFLPRLIGVRRAQELMLTNRTLSAEQACEWGLINQVVEADKVLGAAQELAKRLAAGSLKSHAGVKKLLLCTYQNTLEAQMDLETETIRGCAVSQEGREGVAAFMEKRKPNFNPSDS